MTASHGGTNLPTRFRILNSLRSRPQGLWTLDEMAAEHRIDRSVAFEHLELLVAADLASKQKVSGGRGRPQNGYRYTGAERKASNPPQRGQLLASLLAQSLTMTSEGPERAHAVGRKFGSSLGSLDRLGGEYAIDDRSVHALNCVFEASCESARLVVCGLHAGLVEGALVAAGSICVVTPKGPDGLGGCVFHLEPGEKQNSVQKEVI